MNLDGFNFNNFIIDDVLRITDRHRRKKMKEKKMIEDVAKADIDTSIERLCEIEYASNPGELVPFPLPEGMTIETVTPSEEEGYKIGF